MSTFRGVAPLPSNLVPRLSSDVSRSSARFPVFPFSRFRSFTPSASPRLRGEFLGTKTSPFLVRFWSENRGGAQRTPVNQGFRRGRISFRSVFPTWCAAVRSAGTFLPSWRERRCPHRHGPIRCQSSVQVQHYRLSTLAIRHLVFLCHSPALTQPSTLNHQRDIAPQPSTLNQPAARAIRFLGLPSAALASNSPAANAAPIRRRLSPVGNAPGSLRTIG